MAVWFSYLGEAAVFFFCQLEELSSLKKKTSTFFCVCAAQEGAISITSIYLAILLSTPIAVYLFFRLENQTYQRESNKQLG